MTKPSIMLANGQRVYEGQYAITRSGQIVGPAEYDEKDTCGLSWRLPNTTGYSSWYDIYGNSAHGYTLHLVQLHNANYTAPRSGTAREALASIIADAQTLRLQKGMDGWIVEFSLINSATHKPEFIAFSCAEDMLDALAQGLTNSRTS